ncbi:hypothetical protein [Aureimonas glaciei]|uniref:Uncharacterized protein n=1 Tax=Aureimonas glaciei TaxID=1776957 RepID=A0A916XUQ7_9HYPH|nr:hypothetical protein [Aureimonas glaciei]GGD11756.1 hypothetical protein GCM10011335_13430 [Aureimonas glaciei]
MSDNTEAPKLFMNAYYFGFNETGCRPVDEILSAVAQAGKGYHHTEDWTTPLHGTNTSYADMIQEAANRAANSLAAPPSLEAVKAEARREALEEAAKVAERFGSQPAPGGDGMGTRILQSVDGMQVAAAIRAIPSEKEG